MNIKNALVIGFVLLAALVVIVFLKKVMVTNQMAPQTNGGNTVEESVEAEPENQVALEIFFHNVIENPDMLDCTQVYPTVRTVSTNEPERRALEELLSGVTDEEMEQGFVSNLNPGIDIQSFRIEDGTVYVDFSSEIAEAVAGSCRVQAIEAQIRQTLLQFDHISEVVMTMDNQSDFLQP